MIFGAFISLLGITQAFGWLSLLIGSATVVLAIWFFANNHQRAE
jgi:hypothetical protein